MKHLTHIEPLEDRIAPATILNPYTVTFQDTDGDTAIVKISKPLFTSVKAAANILNFSFNGTGATDTTFSGNSVPESLNEIDLLGRTAAQDMNIIVKVIPQVGLGNGQVNVGLIAAANFSVTDQVSQNIDLGSIYIQGNLGQITAGDNFSTPAIRSLTVLSMNEGFQSDVLGPIGKLNVKGDFNAGLTMIGYQFGSIGKLTIGGSLQGDAAGDSGTGLIEFSGHIGSATIGNITGTAAQDTGELAGTSANPSRIGSLHVLGSITGGSGTISGGVFAESSIGKVTVDGNVMGGPGQDSGVIAGPLGTVNILGGVTGGTGISSGEILGETFAGNGNAIPVAIGSVKIVGNVTGGAAGTAAFAGTPATSTTAAIPATAAVPGDSGIISAASAKSIAIGGSLIGGSPGTATNLNGTLTETADTSGVIMVNVVNSLTIGKNIAGGGGPNSGVITGIVTEVIEGISITPAMKYGSIVVNGGVTGGSGATSGAILVNSGFGGTIASLHIGGGLTGSSGTQSGEVFASTSLGTLFIGGDVTGGTADNTGEIFSGGVLNGVIHGSLIGDAAISSGTPVVGSGYIQAGHIGTLDIKGNVTSGANSGGGGIANSGAIRSSGDILSLIIEGTVTGTSANPVFISATQGPGTGAKPKTDLAIQAVTIDGAAKYLDLLAGYSPTVSTTSGSTTNPAGAPLGTPTDGTAQIGTVTFKSTLMASNVVAGAEPDSSGQFGTAGNTAIAKQPGRESLHSIIANIIVDGQATGDATPADSFGFVAEQLKTVEVNGILIPTDQLAPGTPAPVNSTNLFLLEVLPPA